MSSSGKVAIITGAGTGIGKQVAIALVHEGYAVALAGRRKEPLEATAEAAKAGGSANLIASLIIPTDVSDPASVKALFGVTREKFGRLDLLFNNAGIGARAVPLEELAFEQ